MADNHITDVTLKTYDKALISKLRERIPVVNGVPVMQVVYAPTNLAFEYAMKRKQVDNTTGTNNQIVLPLLSLYRPSGFSLSDMTHEVLGHREPHFYVQYKNTKPDGSTEVLTRNIQRIFVDIPYQLDIWTDSESDMAEVVQSMLFLFKREQSVDVKQLINGIILPDGSDDNADINYIIKITLDNNVTDNTDLESESDNGKLYRYTLTFMLEDAILIRDTSLGHAKFISVDTMVEGKSGKVNYTYDVKED